MPRCGRILTSRQWNSNSDIIFQWGNILIIVGYRWQCRWVTDASRTALVIDFDLCCRADFPTTSAIFRARRVSRARTARCVLQPLSLSLSLFLFAFLAICSFGFPAKALPSRFPIPTRDRLKKARPLCREFIFIGGRARFRRAICIFALRFASPRVFENRRLGDEGVGC